MLCCTGNPHVPVNGIYQVHYPGENTPPHAQRGYWILVNRSRHCFIDTQAWVHYQRNEAVAAAPGGRDWWQCVQADYRNMISYSWFKAPSCSLYQCAVLFFPYLWHCIYMYYTYTCVHVNPHITHHRLSSIFCWHREGEIRGGHKQKWKSMSWIYTWNNLTWMCCLSKRDGGRESSVQEQKRRG